jgi:uncharacterized surface protein with fasciclin (FAS1) repeats
MGGELLPTPQRKERFNMVIKKNLAVLAVAAIALTACGSSTKKADAPATTKKGAATTAAPAAAAEKDIVDTAVAAGSFKTLASLLTAAGLVDTLKGPGPFTVFAPTDEAFAKVDAATLAKLAANKDALKQVLTYHVVAGKVMAKDVKTGNVKMVSGGEAKLTAEGGKVMIDKANVTTADIAAKNGVIHVIDAVILPADLKL